jgi:O-acetyl-ADP-ribose deacetylase (regulator of RNase III)
MACPSCGALGACGGSTLGREVPSVREIKVGSKRLYVLRGDITELGRHVGVIVNAASEDLRAGTGGVSGAIHAAGGMEIAVECRWIGQAETGTAVVTAAGRLDADAVIHAVGPVWTGGRANEEKLLSSAYRSALELAEHHGLPSIAFPSISTGTFGFPADRAANVAVGTVAAFLRQATAVKDVYLVQFSEEDSVTYNRCLDRLLRVRANRAAFEAGQLAS